MNQSGNINQIGDNVFLGLQGYERLGYLWQNKELYIFTHGEKAFEQAELDCFPHHDNPKQFISSLKSLIKYK